MPDSIEFIIQVPDEATKNILIARLSEAGANGFEEEKKLLKVFAFADTEQASACKKIILESQLEYTESILAEKNWNAQWEASFEPVTIGKFCTIRAGFHLPLEEVKYDIVITPKMSFGTGHHATTHLMVQAMERLDFDGKLVFDFGTGTGVLAVLAEKCGASAVTAIDNDDWSINNAAENFALNNCHKILLTKEEGFLSDARYDVILANINRNVILAQLPFIQQHLVKNGVVLLSGLLTGDENVIVEKAQLHKLVLQEKTEMNGWICLRMVSG